MTEPQFLASLIFLPTHLDLWQTTVGDGIPVKHRDTTKTAEQDSQNGDQRTTVRTQPCSTHSPSDANRNGRNHTAQIQL